MKGSLAEVKEEAMRLAKRAPLRSLFGASVLLLLAACADQRAVTAAPASDSALVAVDLGGSSRIPHIAGLAGEGEGYGTVQPTSTDHASMAGKPMAQTSMPGTDHSAMGYGSTPSVSQSGGGNSPGAGAQVAQASPVQGSGIVNSVDPSSRKINLSHDPITAIGWPAMTMDFAVAPSVDLRQIKAGTHVTIMMQHAGIGTYVIQSITPAGGGH